MVISALGKILFLFFCFGHSLMLTHISNIQLLESPIPTTTRPSVRPSVTKSVKWRYLGNQAWYHRSAVVKTTRKNSELENSKKKSSRVSSIFCCYLHSSTLPHVCCLPLLNLNILVLKFVAFHSYLSLLLQPR